MLDHTRVLLWLCLQKYDDVIGFLSASIILERKIAFKYILYVLISFNSVMVGFNCSQTGRLDTGVKVGEIRVRWNEIHDFSNCVQSYADDTDFVDISEKLDIF